MAEHNEVAKPEIESEANEAKERKRRKRRKRAKQPRVGGGGVRGWSARVAFPKDAVAKCLRIPQGILDQNAGNECSDREAPVTPRSPGLVRLEWKSVRRSSTDCLNARHEEKLGQPISHDRLFVRNNPRIALMVCVRQFCRLPS